MSTKKFFSGNTLEQALLQAARHFELEPERVAYEQVDRRHGFLKVRRRVVIGVDPESPEQAGALAESAPAEVGPAAEERSDRRPERSPQVTEPLPSGGNQAREEGPKQRADSTPESSMRQDAWSAVSPADAKEAAHEALRRLLRLGQLDLNVEVAANDEGLEIELSGRDEEELFEDRGRLLMAIQHLLPRMIRGLTGSAVQCRVDSDNYHEVRAEQLRVIAQEAAAEVRREGRIQTLEPMSPDERRIIHLTLADDPAVETESHGSGLFKRVTVRPLRREPRARVL